MQDAGTNHSDHYRSRMGRVRFAMREWTLEYVRKETDFLSALQHRVRTPFLDTYFATTANLGTHTFYMIMLPVFCWCDYMDVGESVITVLALGVYITGYVKDLLCLPRPRSPPLHRISTSGSAIQEYGFPSTHSCNALSVILVFLVDNNPHVAVYWLCIAMGISIVTGRLYTGMHGFIDVIMGLFFGWLSWVIGKYALQWFHANLRDPSGLPWGSFTLAGLALASLVIFHPQPVDPCPCYDDSVAFLSVVFGIELGGAIHALSPSMTWPTYVYRGPLRAVARFVLGVSMVVLWRYVAKRTLLRCLPPIWRFFETSGLALPRRNYLKASEYDRVPRDLPDELFPDSPKQIATMIRTVRRTHGRSDSVGPQNIADVYEAEAYRQSSAGSRPSTPPPRSVPPLPSGPLDGSADHSHSHEHTENSFVMPRVRYDVEIVTKIIVYCGISLTAAVAAPAAFAILGI